MTYPARALGTHSARPFAPRLRLILASYAILIAGCASPGVPKPPSLMLPAPVTDLRAVRIGNAVALHWTNPSETTDRVALRPPLTVNVCRDVLHTISSPGRSSPGGTIPCSIVYQLRLPPGESTATDSLPASLLAEPAVALEYRILLPNAAGHDAGPSNRALAASGPAPSPIAELHARSVPAGVQLTWMADHSAPGTSIELLRTPALAVSAQPPTGITTAPHPRRASLTLPGSTAHSSPHPTRLLAVAADAPDRGGAIDPTPERDHTYTYSAIRLRTVSLGGASLSLHSADSAPVTLLVHDVAPPAAPTELLAATDGLAADLSWQPGFEPDLAGYLVDRAELPPDPSSLPTSPPWHRLTPAPLSAPAFHNTLPHAGRFAFRVIAVDTSGTQGPASTPVLVDARPITP